MRGKNTKQPARQEADFVLIKATGPMRGEITQEESFAKRIAHSKVCDNWSIVENTCLGHKVDEVESHDPMLLAKDADIDTHRIHI